MSRFECFSSPSELNYFCCCHVKLGEKFTFKDLVFVIILVN